MVEDKTLNEYDLDLDVLAPQARIIKLNNQAVEVYPPKFTNLVELMKLVKKFESITPATSEEKALEIVSEIKDRLMPVMPKIKEPEFDLSIEQLNALIRFVFTIAQPKDTAMLKKAGYSINEDAQKKTPQEPLN